MTLGDTKSRNYDCKLIYNCIIGRPTIIELGVVSSTMQLKLIPPEVERSSHFARRHWKWQKDASWPPLKVKKYSWNPHSRTKEWKPSLHYHKYIYHWTWCKIRRAADKRRSWHCLQANEKAYIGWRVYPDPGGRHSEKDYKDRNKCTWLRQRPTD